MCLYTDAKEIGIEAIRKIKAGEELTYDYGKDHFNEYIKPTVANARSARAIRLNPYLLFSVLCYIASQLIALCLLVIKRKSSE